MATKAAEEAKLGIIRPSNSPVADDLWPISGIGGLCVCHDTLWLNFSVSKADSR
jgi:hypothetical protein